MSESRTHANIAERLALERQRVAELKAEVADFQKNLAKANALLLPDSSSDDGSSPVSTVATNTSKQVLIALKAKVSELKQEEKKKQIVQDQIKEHYFLFEEADKLATDFVNKTEAENDAARQLLSEMEKIRQK